MKAWDALNADEWAATEQLFEAMLVRDTLLANKESTAVPQPIPIGLEELYAFAWVSLPNGRYAAVRAAVARDGRVAALLDEVLAETAHFALPAAAAADTGDTGSREIHGVHIRWQDSSAAPDQTYVVITITHGEASFPSVLIARRGEGEVVVEPLPEPVGDKVSVVYEREAPLIAALKDWRTRIYLG